MAEVIKETVVNASQEARDAFNGLIGGDRPSELDKILVDVRKHARKVFEPIEASESRVYLGESCLQFIAASLAMGRTRKHSVNLLKSELFDNGIVHNDDDAKIDQYVQVYALAIAATGKAKAKDIGKDWFLAHPYKQLLLLKTAVKSEEGVYHFRSEDWKTYALDRLDNPPRKDNGKIDYDALQADVKARNDAEKADKEAETRRKLSPDQVEAREQKSNRATREKNRKTILSQADRLLDSALSKGMDKTDLFGLLVSEKIIPPIESLTREPSPEDMAGFLGNSQDKAMKFINALKGLCSAGTADPQVIFYMASALQGYVRSNDFQKVRNPEPETVAV